MYIIGKMVVTLKMVSTIQKINPHITPYFPAGGGAWFQPSNQPPIAMSSKKHLWRALRLQVSHPPLRPKSVKIHGVFTNDAGDDTVFRWLFQKKTTDRNKIMEQKHKVQVFARYHVQWMPFLWVMLKVSTFAFEGRFVVVVMRSIQHQTCCMANQVSQSSTCWNPENLQHMHGNHHVAMGCPNIFQWTILLYSYEIILRYSSKKIYVILDWQSMDPKLS